MPLKILQVSLGECQLDGTIVSNIVPRSSVPSLMCLGKGTWLQMLWPRMAMLSPCSLLSGGPTSPTFISKLLYRDSIGLCFSRNS